MNEDLSALVIVNATTCIAEATVDILVDDMVIGEGITTTMIPMICQWTHTTEDTTDMQGGLIEVDATVVMVADTVDDMADTEMECSIITPRIAMTIMIFHMTTLTLCILTQSSAQRMTSITVDIEAGTVEEKLANTVM